MTERRLAAIMFTDIVGSTAVTARSEAAGLALRDRHRELVRRQVERYHGRFIEAPGDESLSTFASALDTVHTALAIQEQLEEDAELQVRIGIHLGEIVFRGNEVFGDGVNIAARVRELAEPGQILMSGEVAHVVQNQTDISTTERGESQLKGVARLVSIYEVTGNAPEPGVRAPDSGAGTLIGVDSEASARPAIAVLPFENLSNDPEQEYLADGIADDLLTRMARWDLPVVARNSSFAYKGQRIDVREAGRGLGARYLVEGSVRRAGTRIRLSVQLTDARTGEHVWTDRFDREIDDVFALQDDIVAAIERSMAPSLQQRELSRALAAEPASVDAWDAFLRAQWHRMRFTREAWEEGQRMVRVALSKDARFARAHALQAYLECDGVANGWARDREAAIAEGLAAARRAIALDPASASAQEAHGVACFYSGDRERARRAFDRAVALEPRNPGNWTNLGWFLLGSSDFDAATDALEKAIRLGASRSGGREPLGYLPFLNLAAAHFGAGRDEDALRSAEEGLLRGFHPALAALTAAILAQLGRAEEARRQAASVPGLRLRDVEPLLAYERTLVSRILDGLRSAGVPK